MSDIAATQASAGGLGLFRFVRGIGARQVRIACGLVLFAYLFSHLTNHALGNVSYEAMEAWLQYHMWWWRSPPGATLLCTAAIVHLLLGLWALYQRRHFRYWRSEIMQLLLGLSIPLLLVSHFVDVRLQSTLFNRDIHYAQSLATYWVVTPYMKYVQFVLLLVAWTHACIGLHYWLRLKRSYVLSAPFFRAVAVLLPAFAVLGLVHAGRQVVTLASDPQWRAINLTPPRVATADQRVILDAIIFYFPIGYGCLIGAVFAARGVRAMREGRNGTVVLSYPDRKVRVPKGLSVLDASLRYGIPHASVCGGRARCSTCRIRVVSDPEALPRPSAREAFVLERAGLSADRAIRLACQLRPQSDVAFIPMLPPNIGAASARNRARAHIGEERYIVSMFADMRGSTKLAEQQLPFDTVFLVNRFLAAVSGAVLEGSGQPNQILGDGLLALFGLESNPVTACRQAVLAAAKIAANVKDLNRQLAEDSRKPIQFGIGIHGGEVIVGDVGFRDHMVFTAIGDPVNVAARLQEMTKSLECPVIVSEEVLQTAGIALPAFPRTQVTIRGRNEPVVIWTVGDPAILPTLFDPETVGAATWSQ